MPTSEISLYERSKTMIAIIDSPHRIEMHADLVHNEIIKLGDA